MLEDATAAELHGVVVGADFTGDGKSMAVVFSGGVFRIWRSTTPQSVADLVLHHSCCGRAPFAQHEAIGLSEDASGIFLLPEGISPPLSFIQEMGS